MAKAGKNYKKILVSATGADDSWYCVTGVTDANIDRSGNSIETTHFCSDSAFKQYIQGLKEFGLSISGNFEPGDTNGQNVLDTANENGASVHVAYLILDTVGASVGLNKYTGWKSEVTVESFNQSGSVGDKEGFDCALKLAEGAVPTRVASTELNTFLTVDV